MAELVILLALVGVVIALAWVVGRPALRRSEGPVDPREQPAVTDRDVVPPRRPNRPIPGSQPDRERKGRP